MTDKLILLSLFVTALLMNWCHCTATTATEMSLKSERSSEEDVGERLKASESLVAPLLNFTSNLFAKVRSEQENAILSPLSIHAALNLLLLGAKTDSVTEKELRKTLGYPEDKNGEQLLEYHEAYKRVVGQFRELAKAAQATNGSQDNKEPIADFYNTIITKVSQPLSAKYSEQIDMYYNSSVESIDPKNKETMINVANRINKWGKEAGFQSDIFSAHELQDDFSAILLSAVRVQAFWFKDFEEYEHDSIFHNYGLKDQKVAGHLLHRGDLKGRFLELTTGEDRAKYPNQFGRMKAECTAADFEALKDLNVQVVGVPLRGGVNIVFFDPKRDEANPKGDELQELAKKLLTNSRLERTLNLLDQLETSRVQFNHVALPKFGFEKEIDLVGSLKSIGLSRVFDQSLGELQQVMNNYAVYVDKVKHKAMIEVNKFGIKAAGVTQIHMIPLMLLRYNEPLNIRLENPFIFVLRYERIPMFIGQVVKLDKKSRYREDLP